MSIDIGASANASVSADAGASASVGGGIGGSLAGAVDAGLSAGLSVAGSLALNAAASFSANANFSAGFSFGAAAAPPVGANPFDILPNFKFIVTFQNFGPMRFQSIGALLATQTMTSPSPPAHTTPPAAAQHPSGSGGGSTPAGSHTTTPPANPTPAAPQSSAHGTTTVGQGGAGGATTRLPSGNWTWGDLVLKRGVAKDGIPLMTWLMSWLKSNRTPRLDVTVIVLDLEGKPAMTWHFKQCFPTKWGFPDLSAQSPNLYIETITLAFDGSPELILT